MTSRQSGFLRAGARGLLGAAAAGVVYRNARTLSQVRAVLPLGAPGTPSTLPPKVTAVVPARNEAAVLDACVRALREQTHGSRTGAEGSALRIVVVDDSSTDDTPVIARRHAEEDPRVRVVRLDELPEGWSGKVHAMHSGVAHADEPEAGEWLMFVDADMQLGPELVGRLLSTAEGADADLVSTPGSPPEQHSATWPWLMPAGLQLIGENAAPDGRGRKAFAIGHCILLRRSHYDKIGGWSALASVRNEDIAIATRVRDHGGTTQLVDSGRHAITTGMDPFRQGWRSFRKSFVAGTRGSVPALTAIGVGQIAASLAAPAAALVGLGTRRRGLAAVGAAGWAVQSAAHARTARLMGSDPRYAPLAPASGALFGSVLLDGVVRVVRGKTAWKGRRTRY
ncbi:glycosyltransferase family 2 protein [Salinifilum ghardaiensis]